MRHLLTSTLLLSALPAFGAGPTAAVEPRSAPQQRAPDTERPALAHYNLSKKGLALEGYDPVAYFPEHGAKATKGLETITAVHEGVTYRFATEANKASFLKTPASFEPQYGGWCAWAMADGKGDKVDVDPRSFLVEDGRLYLFYDGFFGDTRKSWSKAGGAKKLAARAVENWARITAPKK
jgi:YHS domain-containing protein